MYPTQFSRGRFGIALRWSIVSFPILLTSVACESHLNWKIWVTRFHILERRRFATARRSVKSGPILMTVNSLENASCHPETTHRGTLLVQVCYRIEIPASMCLTGRKYCYFQPQKIRQQHGLPSQDELGQRTPTALLWAGEQTKVCALIGWKPVNQIFRHGLRNSEWRLDRTRIKMAARMLRTVEQFRLPFLLLRMTLW